jgi:hypothetical protein
LYTVFLGESGFPRKSSSIGYESDFFRVFTEPEACPELRIHAGFGSGEGFARFLLGEREKTDLSLLGVPVVLLLDELKLFVDKCQQQTGGIGLSLVSTLYEQNRFENTTVRKPILIPECYVSLLAASTLDTFGQIWASEFLSIGFPNRLLLVPGITTKRVALPWKPDSTVLESLQNRVKRFFEKVVNRHRKGCNRIDIEPAAQGAWEACYASLERSIHARRLDALFFRLSQILALTNEQFVITKEVALAAIDVVHWQLQVRKLHDPIDAANTVARIEEGIRRNLQAHGTMTARELKLWVNARRCGVWIWETALKNVCRSGDVRCLPGKPVRYEIETQTADECSQ